MSNGTDPIYLSLTDNNEAKVFKNYLKALGQQVFESQCLMIEGNRNVAADAL